MSSPLPENVDPVPFGPALRDESERLRDLALDVEDILRRHAAGLNESERFVLRLAAFEIRETAEGLSDAASESAALMAALAADERRAGR